MTASRTQSRRVVSLFLVLNYSNGCCQEYKFQSQIMTVIRPWMNGIGRIRQTELVGYKNNCDNC